MGPAVGVGEISKLVSDKLLGTRRESWRPRTKFPWDVIAAGSVFSLKRDQARRICSSVIRLCSKNLKIQVRSQHIWLAEWAICTKIDEDGVQSICHRSKIQSHQAASWRYPSDFIEELLEMKSGIASTSECGARRRNPKGVDIVKEKTR